MTGYFVKCLDNLKKIDSYEKNFDSNIKNFDSYKDYDVRGQSSNGKSCPRTFKSPSNLLLMCHIDLDLFDLDL